MADAKDAVFLSYSSQDVDAAQRVSDALREAGLEVWLDRGEKDRAFEWLERAYVQRDPGLGHVATDNFFAPLRDDPRWAPFVKKMGLE